MKLLAGFEVVGFGFLGGIADPLTGPKSSVYYPELLRRIRYVDTQLDK